MSGLKDGAAAASVQFGIEEINRLVVQCVIMNLRLPSQTWTEFFFNRVYTIHTYTDLQFCCTTCDIYRIYLADGRHHLPRAYY